MKNISDMLHDIALERCGYSIGEPWRFTEHSLAAVVPLIREPQTQTRSYRLLSERKSDVKVIDRGNIEVIPISNTGEYPVLIRTGEVFTGDTQSRTVTISQVIMPGEKLEVPCACVHASKGIRGGQRMDLGAFSPSRVRREVYRGHYDRQGSLSPIYSRHQEDIWGGVKSYAKSAEASTRSFQAFMHSTGPTKRTSGPSLEELEEAIQTLPNWRSQAPTSTYSSSQDDLAGRISESQAKLKEILKQVPKAEHQIGIALLTMTGLESLEAFEHPDSWEGIRRALLGAESDKLADVSDQNGLFEFRAEKAKGIIHGLLTSEFAEKVCVDRPRTQTVILDVEKFTGEVVTLDDCPIHATFLRKEN